MQRHLPVLVVTLALVACAHAQRPRADSRPASASLESFTVESGTLKSGRVKRGEAGYSIYLPKGYADEANRDKKYPLVVWLHGFGGANRFAGSGGAEVIDSLRKDGKVPELLVVVFRPAGGRSVYLNGEPQGDTEDVIVHDLLAQLRAKYRVADGAGQHALMGESMGGMAALKIAMRHPDVFGVVAAHSAAILPADPAELPTRYARQAQMMMQNGLDKVFGDPIDKAKWAQEMPLGLVATQDAVRFQGLKIYFDAGTDDRYGFFGPNQELDKAMTAKGIAHVFRSVQGGGHAWASPSMKQNIRESMQFVGAAFADPVREKERAGSKGEAQPKGASEREDKK